jgi:VWFA-related protein
MKTKAFLPLLLSFCVFLPAVAQTKPATAVQPQQPSQQDKSDDKDDVVRITTNLVQVDAVVTKDGKVVPNLTAEDFEIFEDGHKQAISSFAFISNVPNSTQPVAPDTKKSTDVVPSTLLKRDDPRRIMAVVVDDLGLSADSMYQVRRQLRKFVAEQLQPNDLVAIIRTGGEMGALQQFTNDRRLLNRAVDQLRWNMCNRVGTSVLQPLGSWAGSSLCGYRSLYSTLKSLGFIVDAMGYLPGRKSLVLLSDSMPREDQDELIPGERVLRGSANIPEVQRSVRGVDNTGENQLTRGVDSISSLDSINYSSALQKIAEKAIRSSVVIYSVDTQGLQVTGLTAADASHGGGPGLQELNAVRSQILWMRREGGELIAKQSGGFQIRNSNSFGLNRILEDQSGYYLIGYRPTDETFNRRFHHIKAKVKRSGMTLRTRFGFFGVTEEEASRSRITARDMTNLALASPFEAQDIEVDLTSFFANDKTSGPVVRSFAYVSPKDLAFTLVNDRQQASIEFHGIIFGNNGAVIDQLKRGATVRLSEREYARVSKDGLGFIIDLPVKRPGDYQMRVAIRDRVSSRIGSAGQFVSVPNLKDQSGGVGGLVLGSGGGAAKESIANPGARRFEQNSDLYFDYAIYNGSQLVNPVVEVRLFRDGKVVYSGPEVPVQTANQADPNQSFVNGSIKLTPDLGTGNYYLQIVLTDKAKNKAAPVVQWIDFEIVKSQPGTTAPVK